MAEDARESFPALSRVLRGDVTISPAARGDVATSDDAAEAPGEPTGLPGTGERGSGEWEACETDSMEEWALRTACR
jgi:hypothetical protein